MHSSDVSPEPSSEVKSPKRVRAVVKSLLTTVCGAAMLMSAAAVLDPATLQASSTAAGRPLAASDQHQQVADAVSALMTRAERVLALRPGDADRGVEIVLWLDDSHDAGRVNADELALIRHNRLFQTVTFYSVAPIALNARASARGSAAHAGIASFAHSASANTVEASRHDQAIDAEVFTPGFTDRWRGMSAVQARVLAAGISDMRVESFDGVSALSNLRVHLQWGGDSVDDGSEASAIVRANRREDLGGARPPSQQEYIP